MVEDSRNFKDRLYRLPEVGMGYDCKFIVGKGEQVATIFAHKFLFAVTSDVFKAMFFGGLEVEECVRIVDLEPQGFESMKHFIYTGEIRFESIGHASETYLAAHKYLLPVLLNLCVVYIRDNIEDSEKVNFFSWCDKNRISEFDSLCLEYVTEKTYEIFQSNYFLDCEPNVILRILQCESMRLNSELSVFINFERWALAEARRRNIIDDRDQMATYFNDFKPYIRFLTMSNEQLTNNVSKSLLLTDEEKLAIGGAAVMNISPDQLPKTICFSKVKRKLRPEPRKRKSQYDYDSDY
ncbi:BTB/POZ domain-containing protein 2-like [Nilaparvata lugens]|uniref:BTB/POZ domain-containing protein 2-like n=1 Tax=Nilaparvata lugens TaxID=108931 RepID=UPI00193E973B|nr:BTB/POZ domain-containing protein 2-like [Nilaparvata lugens]